MLLSHFQYFLFFICILGYVFTESGPIHRCVKIWKYKIRDFLHNIENLSIFVCLCVVVSMPKFPAVKILSTGRDLRLYFVQRSFQNSV